MAMKRMWSKGQVKNLSKEVIESGLVDNAKPIYYHPIYYTSNNGNCRIQACILDNTSTAYTITSFIAKVKTLLDNGASINIGGCIREDSEHDFINAYLLLKVSPDYRIYAFSPSQNNVYFALDSYVNANGTLVDGVNKIN